MTLLPIVGTIDGMDRCDIYCGKLVFTEENVISTRSLLLALIINLLFSPCNLPQLAYAICNLCLYLFCNCFLQSFVQI